MAGAADHARRRIEETDREHFSRHLGLELASMDGGTCEVRLRVGDRHKNLGGVVHGGVIAAMLDSAMGGAVVSTLGENEWCGTANLNTQFLRWGEDGELTGRGTVVKRGRRLAFVEGVLTGSGGKEIARATGVWYVWNTEEPASPQPRPPEGA